MMQIASDDGQGNVALEAVDPMIGTDIQSVCLQGIDGRFHRTVAAAQADELGIALALTLAGRALALPGHDRKGDDCGQSLLVGVPRPQFFWTRFWGKSLSSRKGD